MKPSILLLAHNIRSLWNVGSFFRSSDAFGVDHLYLTGYTSCPPRQEISKTALGAESTVAWSYHKDPLDVIKQERSQGSRILALERTEKSIPLRTWAPADRILLIVGHEITGVPDVLLSEADEVVHIPMHGTKESLNVAVAAGIALDELCHGRP